MSTEVSPEWCPMRPFLSLAVWFFLPSELVHHLAAASARRQLLELAQCCQAAEGPFPGSVAVSQHQRLEPRVSQAAVGLADNGGSNHGSLDSLLRGAALETFGLAADHASKL